MNEFIKEDLEFYLPDYFKGLNKKYILDKIFDERIQSTWIKSIGDIIVGPTGNIFVISNIEYLNDSIGGTRYYFGGGMCNRDGGNFLTETYCYTANESGKKIDLINGEIYDPYHSNINKFRYVPYPHEL
jgi:hypothetical protein